MFTQFAKTSNPLQKSLLMSSYQMRYFGVVHKLAKQELTVRTPYRTLFENFANYRMLSVRTIGGNITLGNRSQPRMYLLPPGEMKVCNIGAGEGNHSTSDTGYFIHTGGWLFVHE